MRLSIQNVKNIQEIVLTDCMLSLEEFIAVVRYHAKLTFSEEFVEKIKASRGLIDKFLEEGRIIYGVTTGFGENVRFTISPEDAVTLQKNIVRSHSCAVGEPLKEDQVRALMFMMILNTGKGLSGIKLDTLCLLKEFLNRNLIPYAPGEGSVGYLSVEGHIAMTLMGEGYLLEDGKKRETLEVLKEQGLTPVEYGCKEGLSLLNGSTSVTGLALLALYDTAVAMKNMEVAGTIAFEALKGTTKALDPRIHKAKNHREEAESAEYIRKMLEGSEICEKYVDAKVQDSYVMRSMAHINGAVKKLIAEAHEVILEEMHAVSDNPEIFPVGEDDGVALMCGNFDGSYVGSHADMLAMACAIGATMADRFIDRMINHKLSDGLPPFLVANPGLNNGYMIPQYTTAGLVGELKVLAHPSTIDNISTCANQEDPVSLAYFAAKKAGEAARKFQYVVAIELMVALQAVDFLAPLAQAPVTKKVHDFVRKTIPFLDNDRYIHPEIERFYQWIHQLDIVELVEEELGEIPF